MNAQTYFHFYFIHSLLGKPKLVDAITHLRGAFYNIALLLRARPSFIPVDRVPAFLSLLLDMILILLSFSTAPPILLSIHFSTHLHILCLLIWKLIPLILFCSLLILIHLLPELKNSRITYGILTFLVAGVSGKKWLNIVILDQGDALQSIMKEMWWQVVHSGRSALLRPLNCSNPRGTGCRVSRKQVKL